MAQAIDARAAAQRAPTAQQPGGRARQALAQLGAQAAAHGGWAVLNNGLSADENWRLARTHRPSQVAALIATGLGRLSSP